MKDEPSRDVVVFTEALKISLRERDSFLEHACAGDGNLRCKVEALLRAHDRLEKFLDQPPIGGH